MITPAKLRSDLVTSWQESRGQVYIIVKDPRAGRYFRLREPEFWLINQFDGKTSPEEIARRFEREFQSILPDGAVDQFALRLDSLYFLDTDRAEYETSRSLHRATGGRKASLVSRLLFVKLSVFNPDRFLNPLLALYRPLHGKTLFVMSWLFLALGLGALWANFPAFSFSFFEAFTLGSLLTVMVSLAGVILLHELAHMLTCRIHGGQVSEVGFLLLYFQPCFFANLSDAWLFEKKSQRLAALWAGPYMPLLTLAAAALIWRVTVVGSALNEIALITAIVSMVTVLFNFNPLIKLDGYYLLSDWLEIPNLRARAFGYFGRLIQQKLLGIPLEPALEGEPGWRERRIFFWYATLSSIYSLALTGYFYTLLWSWLVPAWGLAGALALIAAPVYTLRRELLAALGYFARPATVMKNIFASPLRGISYLVALAVAGVILFAIPFTDRVSGPVELRALRRFSISGGPGGQIKTEYRIGGARPDVVTGYLSMSSLELSALNIRRRVSAGDRALKGDTLLAVTSNQITAELDAARSALAALEARLALLKSPPKAESLLSLRSDAQALESEYRRAKTEVVRKRELFSKNLIARNELDDAEAEEEMTRSRWESASALVLLSQSPPKPEEEAVITNDIRQQESQIAFLESQAAAQVIVSPFHGRVASGSEPGELVVVIDDNQVEAIVSVSDYDIEKVSAGQVARLMARSFPGRTFEGIVSRISQAGEVEDETGRFEVATLFDNSDSRLKPGMSGYAKIEVGRKSLFGLILDRLGSLIRVEFWSRW
ncbi:MAG: efflux RND transporter periplasmic adaptor subunit [Candidatus Zixiibacteriota bacterium]